MFEKKWSTLCNCSGGGGGEGEGVFCPSSNSSIVPFISRFTVPYFSATLRYGRPSWIGKARRPLPRFKVTEITVRSGKLALYPVDLTKK